MAYYRILNIVPCTLYRTLLGLKKFFFHYGWEIHFKTEFSPNPDNLSTKVDKKENNFIIE